MDYSIYSASLENCSTACMIVGIYENQQMSTAAETLNTMSNGLIHNILERGDMQGKENESVLISYVPDCQVEQILLIGLGSKLSLNTKKYRKALGTAINKLKTTKITAAVCTLAEAQVIDCDSTWKSRQIVEIFEQACYRYSLTKSKDTPSPQPETIQIAVPEDMAEAAQTGMQQGVAIAAGVALTKQLADLPGNYCTPAYLAEQAEQLGQKHVSLSVNILEESDMQELGMGSLLSVSNGSREPAKLIVMHYQGADSDTPPIALVGKGLTFDAGGISLKPGAGMDEMKYDMCGGASVFGALSAACDMQLPLNIIGLIPASENLPDGAANKPGDIVTSMSGQTIEILNTDAEGRLILCDTLTYAQQFEPEVIIDMATLTGACIIALGRQPSGLFGNDDALCDDLIAASESACDSVWRMPIWEEYQDQLKSNFADMANIGGRDAGSITAACFLSRYTENQRWAHLDIAGTAWTTGKNKGATGRPVPLLCQYLLNRTQEKSANLA